MYHQDDGKLYTMHSPLHPIALGRAMGPLMRIISSGMSRTSRAIRAVRSTRMTRATRRTEAPLQMPPPSPVMASMTGTNQVSSTLSSRARRTATRSCQGDPWDWPHRQMCESHVGAQHGHEIKDRHLRCWTPSAHLAIERPQKAPPKGHSLARHGSDKVLLGTTCWPRGIKETKIRSAMNQMSLKMYTVFLKMPNLQA